MGIFEFKKYSIKMDEISLKKIANRKKADQIVTNYNKNLSKVEQDELMRRLNKAHMENCPDCGHDVSDGYKVVMTKYLMVCFNCYKKNYGYKFI
jgi:hypothetical protein